MDLFPQFGNSCGLPQATLERRSDRVERLRNRPIGADECSVGGDIEAKKKRIRTRQTLAEQSPSSVPLDPWGRALYR